MIYLLTSRFKKTGVIFIGYCSLALALFFVGPSKLLGFYNSPSYIYIGVMIMGLGAGLITIPVMPEMIDSVEEIYPDLDEIELHNHLSGVFLAF